MSQSTRSTPSSTSTLKRRSNGATPQSTIASRTASPSLSTTKLSQRNSITPVTPTNQVKLRMRKEVNSTIASADRPCKKIKVEPDVQATEPKELKSQQETIESSDYDDIVFIYIGPEVKSFGLHKGLLTKASSYFRNVLSHDSVAEEDIKSEDSLEIMTHDDGTKAVALSKEDATIFKRFKDWLYTGNVLIGDENPKELLWTALVDLYVFAVRRGIPRLQNSCIDTAIQKIEAGGLFPSQAIINPLWKGFCQRFLHDLVIILYEMKRGGKTEDEIDFWKARHMWHVNMADNPVAID
ncbi:hypothetical protein P7C71_g6305, partial [Lecanoromycetidae sp. Uapishka_2]